MTIVYKLTTADFKTRKGGADELLWGDGVTHTVYQIGETYIRACAHPVLAALLNPIRAGVSNLVLWECEAEVYKSEGLKLDCASLTTLRQIAMPVITIEQRIAFGIHCALAVYDEETFVSWANGWLDGSNRTEEAADAACVAAWGEVWLDDDDYSAQAAAWAAAAARDYAEDDADYAEDWAAMAVMWANRVQRIDSNEFLAMAQRAGITIELEDA